MFKKYKIDPPQQNGYDYTHYEPPCEHKYELRWDVYANDSVHFKMQCVICGKAGNSIRKLDISVAEKDAATPFDKEMYSSWKMSCGQETLSKKRNQDKEQGVAWEKWYSTYLASDVWREKRSLVINRAGGICEGCRSRVANEVHHLTYQYVGNEPLFHLVALCHDCHQKIEAIKDGDVEKLTSMDSKTN